MINTDLRAITRDVSDRLTARQNGLRLKVEDDKTFASEVTVYVFVDILDGGGKESLDVIRLFDSVGREASDRFNVDVLIVPESPEVL
jgi:myo-inositol-1-phosphate synthase